MCNFASLAPENFTSTIRNNYQWQENGTYEQAEEANAEDEHKRPNEESVEHEPDGELDEQHAVPQLLAMTVPVCMSMSVSVSVSVSVPGPGFMYVPCPMSVRVPVSVSVAMAMGVAVHVAVHVNAAVHVAVGLAVAVDGLRFALSCRVKSRVEMFERRLRRVVKPLEHRNKCRVEHQFMTLH